MITLLFPIISTALDILQQHSTGKAKSIEAVAAGLTDIVSKAMAVYQAETGQPMDLSKLKPYVPLE